MQLALIPLASLFLASLSATSVAEDLLVDPPVPVLVFPPSAGSEPE